METITAVVLACFQYFMIAFSTQTLLGGWKGFLRQDFLNRRHICCYVKALKTHNGAVCPVGLVEQFGCQSLAFHQPGSGKHSAVAGVAKQWNLTCYRVSHVWKPVRYFLLFLTGLSFRFQVLGTKYKHELLVDHPFSDLAGSCGNFPFLPLIPLPSPISSSFRTIMLCYFRNISTKKVPYMLSVSSALEILYSP